jgi:isopenicillin N synthase-like dioxygenase
MIPTIDLPAWRVGDPTIGPTVDEALQKAGFLLAAGHGVDEALRADVRAAARRFFALPAEVKQKYSARIGGRGWLAPGVEANGNVEGAETPPDLKESFAVGPETPTGDPAVDAVWFPPNVWPAEVPELRDAVARYVATMTAVSRELLELCADALGLQRDALTALAKNPTWTFNINRYPPLTEVGSRRPPSSGSARTHR